MNQGSIYPPIMRDFDQILLDSGQTIVMRRIHRTTDDDGRITGVTTTDTNIQATVEEITSKKIEFMPIGHYKIGDIEFYVNPEADITIQDKIIWDGKIMGIKEIKFDQKIAGFYVLKMLHCTKDSDI